MFADTLATTDLSKADIEASVDDWVARVAALYSSIKEWLGSTSSYSAKEQSEVTMYEELMQKYQVSPRQLKVLDIYAGDRIIATLKPVGLWIIGANGRVDLLSKEGAVLLVDKADRFHPSSWVMYTREKRNNGVPFDRKYLLTLLGAVNDEHI